MSMESHTCTVTSPVFKYILTDLSSYKSLSIHLIVLMVFLPRLYWLGIQILLAFLL